MADDHDQFCMSPPQWNTCGEAITFCQRCAQHENDDVKCLQSHDLVTVDQQAFPCCPLKADTFDQCCACGHTPISGAKTGVFPFTGRKHLSDITDLEAWLEVQHVLQFQHIWQQIDHASDWLRRGATGSKPVCLTNKLHLKSVSYRWSGSYLTPAKRNIYGSCHCDHQNIIHTTITIG